MDKSEPLDERNPSGEPAGSGSRKGIRKGIYLLPSALTIGNILCGFYAVLNSAKGYRVMENPEQAAVFFDNAARAIGFAVLLDGLDGRTARLTGATSEFGVELDSIADVLSFGIAPSLLAYTWGYGNLPEVDRLAWAASFIFVICGSLRLARFNVLSRAPRFTVAGATPKLDKRSFVGLPIPAAAGLIAAIVHFLPIPLVSLTGTQTSSGIMLVWGLLALVGILSVLMVSTLRYTSFKEIGGRSNKPFIVIPVLSMIFAGIWFYSQWVLLGLAILYVVHGPLFKLFSLLKRLRRPEETISET